MSATRISAGFRAARLLIAAAAAVPSFALRGGFWRNLIHTSLPMGRA